MGAVTPIRERGQEAAEVGQHSQEAGLGLPACFVSRGSGIKPRVLCISGKHLPLSRVPSLFCNFIFEAGFH